MSRGWSETWEAADRGVVTEAAQATGMSPNELLQIHTRALEWALDVSQV